MVLRRLDGCLSRDGEWERDWRVGATVWWDVVDEWRAFLLAFLEKKLGSRIDNTGYADLRYSV
jgi:hypothetical protein